MDISIICILMALLILGGAVFVGAKLGTKRMPSSVMQQGYKNLLITMLILAAIVGVLWSTIFFGFKQSSKNSLWLSGAIIWVAIYVFFLISWFRNRKNAGKILLDLMPYPNKTLVRMLGVLFIILGFSGSYSFTGRDSKYAWLVSSLVGLGIGTFQILMSFSHLRVHENGILAYADLVKWKKIESFEWVSGNQQTHTLKLKYKGRLPGFMRAGAVPVPVEKKPELEKILEKYLDATFFGASTPQQDNANL
jgi:uncharacterized protein DUF5673